MFSEKQIPPDWKEEQSEFGGPGWVDRWGTRCITSVSNSCYGDGTYFAPKEILKETHQVLFITYKQEQTRAFDCWLIQETEKLMPDGTWYLFVPETDCTDIMAMRIDGDWAIHVASRRQLYCPVCQSVEDVMEMTQKVCDDCKAIYAQLRTPSSKLRKVLRYEHWNEPK